MANKKWRAENPKARARVRRSWKARNPEKDAAHKAVARAIRSGRLVKPERCECCGKPGELLAHHESYHPRDWLLVDFLRRKCHARIHGGEA